MVEWHLYRVIKRDSALLNPVLSLATNAPSAAAGLGATLRVLNSGPVSATSLYEKPITEAAPEAEPGRDGETQFDAFVRSQRGAWDSIDGRVQLSEGSFPHGAPEVWW